MSAFRSTPTYANLLELLCLKTMTLSSALRIKFTFGRTKVKVFSVSARDFSATARVLLSIQRIESSLLTPLNTLYQFTRKLRMHLSYFPAAAQPQK